MPLSAINKTIQVFKDTEREDVEGRGGERKIGSVKEIR